jgi:hypothetical protein
MSMTIEAALPAPAPFLAAMSGGFPRRPEPGAICPAMPLYCICRSVDGLWIAREAGGCRGGTFLFRSSAVRFARKASGRTNPALLIVEGSYSLDVADEGSRAAAAIAAASRAIRIFIQRHF